MKRSDCSRLPRAAGPGRLSEARNDALGSGVPQSGELIGISQDPRWSRAALPAVSDRGRKNLVDGANAEDSDFQHVRARPPYASSSMRSMARLALRAISSGTRTWGVIVSSDWMTLSSVIVFMKAQTALAFTG